MNAEWFLPEFLRLTVPLCLADLQAKGGPDEDDWNEMRAFGHELGPRGDQLLYRTKRSGDMAVKTAHAIAVLSYCPGGITIFGEHWEAAGGEAAGGEAAGALTDTLGVKRAASVVYAPDSDPPEKHALWKEAEK